MEGGDGVGLTPIFRPRVGYILPSPCNGFAEVYLNASMLESRSVLSHVFASRIIAGNEAGNAGADPGEPPMAFFILLLSMGLLLSTIRIRRAVR